MPKRNRLAEKYYYGFSPRNAPDEGARIFEGMEATPHEFPFMVEVWVNGTFRCGGSLIGKKF